MDEEIFAALQNPGPGGVVLFLGAGFSCEAKNVFGQLIPLARDFSVVLADEIGEQPNIPLPVIADLYLERFQDEHRLLQKIKDTFSSVEITEEQRLILSYPWKRIYTTNFDDVAEQVPSPNGGRPDSFDRVTTPIVYNGSTRSIVHLNGFVGNITAQSYVSDLALTLSTYMDVTLFNSPWASLLRQDMTLASKIIFIGYSMFDTDIVNIMGRNPDYAEKTIAIQHERLSYADELFLKRFGYVHKCGVKAFSKIVECAIKSGIKEQSGSSCENFAERTLPVDPVIDVVTDENVEALLVQGIYNRDKFISSSLNGGRQYLFSRTQCESVIHHLRSAGAIALIHSHLGNGKSLIVEQLIVEVLKKGSRVFVLERATNSLSYDILHLKDVTNCVIVIEEYIDNDDFVDIIVGQLNHARLIVTARTSASQVKFQEVFHNVAGRVMEFDINKILDRDLDGLVDYLSAGAYWSRIENVGTLRRRREYIQRQCSSELQSVSLGLIKSVAQHQKVREFFSRPLGKGQSGVILALILTFLELPSKYEFMSELLGVDMFSLKADIGDKYISDLFAASSYGIEARSPVLSLYILENFVSDSDILEISARALAISSQKYRNAERYRTFNSKIMQFSNLSRLVRRTGNFFDKITAYYDRVGEYGYKEFSPYFWLQYGIACRFAAKYRRAERCYSEALRIARSKNDFYTYKLENSYAEFLLESRMNTDYWGDFCSIFVEASRIARSHLLIRETGHFPHNVVSQLPAYLEKRAKNLRVGEVSEIRDELGYLSDRLKSLANEPRMRRKVNIGLDHVQECLVILDRAKGTMSR